MLHQSWQRFCGLALMATGAVCSNYAFAVDFILPGVEAKAAAGAGQTVSRGASALFFNPANVILCQGVEPEADLSFAKITYSYQNAATETFEPAVLGVTTPTASLGGAWRVDPSVALGMEVLPLGLGSTQDYFGAPVEVTTGSFQAMDVSRKEVAAKIAAGGAFRFLKRYTLGLGLIYTTERSSIRTKNAGTERVALEASYAGRSLQPNLGARIDVGYGVIIGLSYRTPVTRAYKGSLSINTAPEDSPAALQSGDFKGVAFEPAALGVGVEWKFLNYGLFGDFVYKAWSAGRSVSKGGLGADPAETDLINTTDLVIGGRYWIGNNHLAQFAIGLNGANVGNGSAISTDVNNRDVAGVQLGQTEAIPRLLLSGGYLFKIAPGRQIEAAMMVLNGRREVPVGYSQPGTFQLQAFVTTLGCNFAI
ncbi:MAG: hypothetical protein FJ146_00890 [Deltaproteobacteria bacterium]|nr:hypothetical protein [Deltaproteobacteria bacterium]